MRIMRCKDCGRGLVKDEIALNKKIVNPDAREFLCLECMGIMFDCSVEDLEIKIDEFKEQGCALFV